MTHRYWRYLHSCLWALLAALAYLAASPPLDSSEIPSTIRFHRRSQSDGLSQAVVTAVVVSLGREEER